MNVFKSNNALYIITIVFAMSGWIFISVANDFKSMATLLYDISYYDDLAILRVKNISRSDIVRDAEFRVSCPMNRQNCLKVDANGKPVYVPIVVAPLWVEDLSIGGNSRYLSTKITIIPNTQVNIRFYPTGNAKDLRFFYLPQKNAGKSVYILKMGSPEGILLNNFFSNLVIIAFIMAISIAIFLIYSFVSYQQSLDQER